MVCLLLFPMGGCSDSSSEKPEQIVVFFLLNAAKADHFSCLGYNCNTAPRVDDLSRRGVLFENHFAQSWATAVSLPQIFSGKYCTRGRMEIADIPRRYAGYPFLEKSKTTPMHFSSNIIISALRSLGYLQ